MDKKQIDKPNKENDANDESFQDLASKPEAENKVKSGDEDASETVLSTVFHEFMSLQFNKWVTYKI